MESLTLGSLLRASLSHLVPERVVEVASAQAGCPVAAYVLDVEGSFAVRLAGDASRFPERIRTPVGVGPEIVREALRSLRGPVIDRVGPSTLWPMVVRDRVMGFLLARDRSAVDLEALGGQAAVALELASSYTDALHSVRRRKDTQPAAEIQQNLLPPRLARVNGADVAGGVLPGYDVGGDFFDYAGNADGLWLVVADATGKGNSAAALSSLAIGALRAARRVGAGLQEAARLADEAILALDMELCRLPPSALAAAVARSRPPRGRRKKRRQEQDVPAADDEDHGGEHEAPERAGTQREGAQADELDGRGGRTGA